MDSYALCPCGSGKKVKFCCQPILSEMSKIERLQENNQPRMALQLIDKLLKENPQNAWLVNQRALALFSDGRAEEARDGLVAFLRKNPEHPLSNALLALAMTDLEPIEDCKKVIHRAFLKSMTAEPRVVALLAGKLVSHFLDTNRDMAARQHMAIVLRLESEQERPRTLRAMLELDSDPTIPYPLRGGHPLPHHEPLAEDVSQAKKAQRLYMHGCFAEAANQLQQISEKQTDSPELWHSIGLMRAWDGDEAAAAVALHKASQLYTDFDRAVDVETLAQLLERQQPENAVASRFRTYEVESVSRLLTRLDNEDRLSRVPRHPEMPVEVAGSYDVLDRPLPPASEFESLTLESLPRTIGRVNVFDSNDEMPASVHIAALEGEQLEETVRRFEAAAGDLVKPTTPPSEGDAPSDILSYIARADVPLMEQYYFPPKFPAKQRLQLRQAALERTIKEIWPKTPQSALGGKSPVDAANDSALKVPLAASIRVLDAILDRQDFIVDQAALRDRLGVPAPKPIEGGDQLDLNAFSVSQLQQINLASLSDEQFERIRQRAVLVKNAALAYRVLNEYVEHRSHLYENNLQSLEQALILLAEISSRSLRHEEALEWLKKGFSAISLRSGSFESQLTWKMRELAYRVRDPQDPQVRELLLELWNHYGAKIPAVRGHLEEFVKAVEIEAPWHTAILTPELAASGGGAPSKLWLPD